MNRKPLQGLKNVVVFNWPKYASAILVVVLLSAACAVFKSGPPMLICAGLAFVVLTLSLTSLAVSYLVYDCSNLYKFDWLPNNVPIHPGQILNLHAGFDESSEMLAQMFPDAQLSIFDFYSPQASTEPSIARARLMSGSSMASEPVGLQGWNLSDSSQDLILIFLAAHELRRKEDRETFFSELKRVLSPQGSCLIVEHLRDAANFLAYGPGFLHFLPRREWLRLFQNCDLKLKEEQRITPFIRVFNLCK